MENLRKLRMEKKLTVSEVSQAARIEAQSIRNYEMGTEIPAHHVERLLKILTVDMKAYFGRHYND